MYAPNGAGKTNFFRGIVYALTGWCDPSWGTQSDLQKDDASAPGYAQVMINIDGHLHTLKRYVITSPKAGDSIDCPDLKLHIEKRQRVNQYLENYLPVSVTILAQLMWIRQSNLSWLLTATPASINTFLGLIFDTKPLEKLRDVLKMVTASIADIRGDQEERIAYWQGVLEQLPDTEDLKKQIEELTEHYTQLASYTGKTILRKSDQEKQASTLQAQIDAHNHIIRQLQEDVNTLKSVLPEVIPDMTQLREQLRKEKKMVNDLTNALQEKRASLVKYTEIGKALEEADSGVCKYCGSTFKTTEEHRRAVLDTYGFNCHYDAAIAGISCTVGTTTQDIQSLEKQLKATQVDQIEATINNTIELNSIKAHLKTQEAELLKQQQLLNQLQTNKSFIDDAIVIPDDEQPIQEQLENCKETLATLRQCLQDATTNKTMAEQSIEQLNKEKEEHEKNSYVKKLFSSARDVLSQSRAQARFINSKLDALNSYIEHYLALSEMPFVLRLDKKEHQFRFHMVGNDVDHPAGMLSGAQQAAASIAVQMALVETAFPELSLLLVDEADAALSPENKFIAAKLYRTLSNAIEGTVLVISQAEEVTADCDNTWELPA